MNHAAIGSYIARKRKEQNLTQEQLAEQLLCPTRPFQNGRTESVCRTTASLSHSATRSM